MTTTDWIQAGASIAAIAVAVVALVIARDARDAEKAQATAASEALMVARSQIDQSRDAEIAREREVQILGIRPVLMGPPNVGMSSATSQRIAFFNIEAKGDHPLLDVTVTLRGMSTGGDWSETKGSGSISPGSKYDVGIAVDPLLTPGPVNLSPINSRAFADLRYRGMLGQVVIETYEWRLDRWIAGVDEPIWRLQQLRIEPTVPGGVAVDQTFDEHLPI